MPEPEIEEFENFDDKDSTEVEPQLPADSYNPEAVSDEEAGCE